ncbi:hypothetical protein HS088_TW17G00694 [Tripterygium wilfordii]|uniref:Zinc finger CCCH domain-containing protein 5 n=1 Tax=Tripterygium wilfordii TaxID=458696 RepID=A0A7J7CGI3_TRIWF|nr:zinc finger CCCH domain-containing protein 5 [Tripterygium wilfordii]KAF5733157.1 hypothetical protein HS088_TW17G00694 [Tripterygium wilfordii]
MAEAAVGEVEQDEGERENDEKKMSRKEKRKVWKKQKRKQARREMAEIEKKEEEATLNDPEEQRRATMMEEEERTRMERERKEFEERERAWMEAMERKKRIQEEEEEKRRKTLEEEEEEEEEEERESKRRKQEDECDEDDDWEYAEEGPAEIIWLGNEIIVRKKKVKVPKKNADQRCWKEDSERPTSNPLPPQSEAFAEYQNPSLVSAQDALENVAQQVPNFGTEQDKAHCPFHLKTGACRFGQRCSRVHFYPDKSCTLLMKNMYNGPGLAWEQDEGLEYTDEEVERCYEEFYEDVHTEFLKFGEIVNFKVCRNGSFHLRGNAYVQYKSLDSAILAYHSINGRYFAGKQVMCEFVNVTRWKVAICGEYMKSRLKGCSHGTACNFIHCFHNPGGDYEWADWDKPPPSYWVKKMDALFGYSDDSGYEKMMHLEHSDRNRTRRSRSREVDHLYGRSREDDDDDEDDSCHPQHTSHDRRRSKPFNGKLWEENSSVEEEYRESTIHNANSEGLLDGKMDLDKIRDRDRRHGHRGKTSKAHNNVPQCSSDYGGTKKRTHEADSIMDLSDSDRDISRYRGRIKRSREQREGPAADDTGDRKRTYEVNGSKLERDRHKERHHSRSVKSTRLRSKLGYPDDFMDSSRNIHDADKEKWSDSRKLGGGHHVCRSKKSEHGNRVFGDNRVSESPDCDRTHDTHYSEDQLDKDKQKHLNLKSRHPRHNSDSLRKAARHLGENLHSIISDDRCGSVVSTSGDISNQDRWDPKTSVPEFEREAAMTEWIGCGSPSRYDG